MNEVIKVNFPNYDEYQDANISDESFTEKLRDFEWLVYSYAEGSYCGTGVSIHKKNGKYHQNNLGHCSCYGPTESLSDGTSYDSIDDLVKNCSDGLNKEMVGILNKIKELEG